MNSSADAAVSAPEVVASAQLIVANHKELLARARPTCPMEHKCA